MRISSPRRKRRTRLPCHVGQRPADVAAVGGSGGVPWIRNWAVQFPRKRGDMRRKTQRHLECRAEGASAAAAMKQGMCLPQHIVPGGYLTAPLPLRVNTPFFIKRRWDQGGDDWLAFARFS
jgi:hypothetical protein